MGSQLLFGADHQDWFPGCHRQTFRYPGEAVEDYLYATNTIPVRIIKLFYRNLFSFNRNLFPIEQNSNVLDLNGINPTSVSNSKGLSKICNQNFSQSDRQVPTKYFYYYVIGAPHHLSLI